MATITPGSVFVGAADIYYRATGVLTAWTSIGALVEDAVFRIPSAWFRPELAGQVGPIKGLDYLSRQMGELEFTMAELGGGKLALALPGATSTTSATTDTGGGGTTTLATAAAIGDVTIYVAAITGLAVGDYVRINVAGALAEYRRLTRVGTAGASGTGTGVSFVDPLLKAHLSGVAVVETVGDGSTRIVGTTVRRQPDASYNDWLALTPSPNGWAKLYLYNAISVSEAVEIAMGDETVGATQVTIQSRGDGTAGAVHWAIETP